MNIEIDTIQYFGHMPVFRMSVAGVFRNDAMLRQVSGAVRISREGKKDVMESKSEGNYVNIYLI